MWGVNTDFSSYELKWTIDAILQHMGFYPTVENPCVMMRVNHMTKSREYGIIYNDELYIALTTFEEIIHITQDKYKIKINPHVYQGSNFPYDPGGIMICLRQYMEKLFTISMSYTTNIHINIVYRISSIPALHTFQHPYIQRNKEN